MQIVSDGLRFAFVGIINTAFTFLLYQLFVTFMAPMFAYWLTWGVGIAFLLVLFPTYVYRGSRLAVKNGVLTVALYLGTLAIGSAALHLLNENGVLPRVAIVFVIFVTSAINFVFSQLLFRGGRSGPLE